MAIAAARVCRAMTATSWLPEHLALATAAIAGGSADAFLVSRGGGGAGRGPPHLFGR